MGKRQVRQVESMVGFGASGRSLCCCLCYSCEQEAGET